MTNAPTALGQEGLSALFNSLVLIARDGLDGTTYFAKAKIVRWDRSARNLLAVVRLEEDLNAGEGDTPLRMGEVKESSGEDLYPFSDITQNQQTSTPVSDPDVALDFQNHLVTLDSQHDRLIFFGNAKGIGNIVPVGQNFERLREGDWVVYDFSPTGLIPTGTIFLGRVQGYPPFRNGDRFVNVKVVTLISWFGREESAWNNSVHTAEPSQIFVFRRPTHTEVSEAA